MKIVFLILSFLIMSNFSFAQDDGGLEKQLDATVNDLTALSPDAFNKEAESKGEKLEESFVSGMMTGVMKQVVNEFLKENPFSKMSKEEIKSMISVRTEGLPVHAFFEKYPKVFDMSVDWIRDEKALPKLIGIVNKPDKVKMYSGIVIGIFIISFMLNLMNSKGNLFKRIFKKLMIFSGATVINFAAFGILFTEEIKPTFDVIFRYYHI